MKILIAIGLGFSFIASSQAFNATCILRTERINFMGCNREQCAHMQSFPGDVIHLGVWSKNEIACRTKNHYIYGKLDVTGPGLYSEGGLYGKDDWTVNLFLHCPLVSEKRLISRIKRKSFGVAGPYFSGGIFPIAFRAGVGANLRGGICALGSPTFAIGAVGGISAIKFDEFRIREAQKD